MYIFHEDDFISNVHICSEYALIVSSEVLLMAHMISCVLMIDGSCGDSISGSMLVGEEEGGLGLVDLKLLCYWSKCFLKVVRILGRCLEIRFVVSHDQYIKCLRCMTRTSVDTAELVMLKDIELGQP